MGKYALLTGGSRGIGAATARLMRERGWQVMTPPRSMLDFADEGTVHRLERQWIENGIPKFDAVVFCHGEWYIQRPRQRQVVDWYRQYTLRVVWPMELMEFLLVGDDAIRPRCVVMVASTRGFIGGVDTGPYAAACAAQIALMQGYGREWPGVRFGVICPGLTDTELGLQVVASGGAGIGAAPQPPEAVAQAIVDFVESDASGKVLRVVNGQVSEARWSW